MCRIQNEKGITLIVLTIMIIIILIISSVTLYTGKNLIIDSKLQSLVTEMLTIRAQAKIYQEEIESKTWDLSEKTQKQTELYAKKGLLLDSTTNYSSKYEDNKYDGYIFFEISNVALENMGLSGLKTESDPSDYVVAYRPESDTSETPEIEIIYTPGFKHYSQEQKVYTLTDLKEIQ